MWYVGNENDEAFFLKLDQENAFDRVSLEYLHKVLHHYGFGANFRKWNEILYHDTRSAVKWNRLCYQIFLE